MFSHKLHFKKGWLFLSFALLASCNAFFNGNEENEPLARVGENYLYKEDVAPFISSDISATDSAAFVVNYINRWASKQLLLSKSKINLPEGRLAEFDRLVNDYKTDLYTKAYMELLVQQAVDTAITSEQLQQFYDAQEENFKLDEKLVQLRFVVLPKPFLDQETVVEKIKTFGEEEKIYLDSIAVQFKKLHFNDSVWVSVSRLMKEIPPLNDENLDRYLKKSQFFELQDSLEVYLGTVTNVLQENDVAPLSFIAPKIKQIILNRRRLQQIKKLETEIIDEAIQQKEFEVYGSQE